MPDQSITLPFTVPNLFAGFAEGNGLAKGSPSELVLEFVVKDTVLDIFKTGVSEIRIPRSEVDVVRFKRGWFGAKVYIRLKSMRWLADFPGCDGGEITLHVARCDRDCAEAFVQALGQVDGKAQAQTACQPPQET
jgi:hypothetical protein